MMAPDKVTYLVQSQSRLGYGGYWGSGDTPLAAIAAARKSGASSDSVSMLIRIKGPFEISEIDGSIMTREKGCAEVLVGRMKLAQIERQQKKAQ